MLIVLLTLTFHLVSGDVNQKLLLAKTPVSSSFIGLEAPLVGAAASPQQRQVISLHHNPDDENNLERLCKDPFHSFLCKPAGPRRRIDGRLRPGALLPPGVQAAASNLREEKQPPLREGSALLSTGQDADRNYLPPPDQKPPAPRPEPQYLPPLHPQKIESLPSNPSNYYLPVHQTTQKPTQPNTKEPVTNKPLTKTYLPIKLTQSVNQQIPSNTNVEPVFIPKNTYLPTDESNVLPESSNLSPNIEGGAFLADQIEPQSTNNEESHTLERLCNDPFHSFLCKPLKTRKRIDGNIRPGAKLPPNLLLTSDSIRKETKVLPTKEGKALLSSSLSAPERHLSSSNQDVLANPHEINTNPFSPNAPKNAIFPQMAYQHLNPKSSIFPTSNVPQHTQNQVNAFFSTTRRPTTNYDDSKTKHVEPQRFGYNYINPNKTFLGRPSDSIEGAFSAQQNYPDFSNPSIVSYVISIQSPLSAAESALKPTNFSNIGILNSSSGNRQQNTLSSPGSGYNYPRPSNPFLLPNAPNVASTQQPIHDTYSTTVRPKVNNPQAYPSNVKENILPSQSSGYSYPKPTITFSTPNPFVQTTRTEFLKPIEISEESRHSNVQQSVFSDGGYKYPKPEKPFSLPSVSHIDQRLASNVQPISFQQVTQSFPYFMKQNPNIVPSPSNIQLSQSSEQKYYNYPKPAVPLVTFPTTIKPTISYTYPTQKPEVFTTTLFTYTTPRPITTIQPAHEPIKTTKNSYQFQSQSNTEQITTKPQETGYYYSKPSTLYTYPTTTMVRPTLPSTVKLAHQYPSSSNIQNVVNGYHYNKPLNSFTYPTPPSTTNPQPFYEYPNPSNIQQNIIKPQDSGYVYDKPSTSFSYPTNNPTFPIASIPTTQRVPTYTPPTPPPQKSNYEYPNPTNIQQSIIRPQEDGYHYSKPSKIFSYPTKAPFTPPNNPNNLNPFPNPTNLDESIAPSSEYNGYNYPKPNNPLPLPSRSNEQQVALGSSSNVGGHSQIRFGDRINPRISPTFLTLTRNNVAHNEEFKTLKNFELI